jgi:hypothetical protein
MIGCSVMSRDERFSASVLVNRGEFFQFHLISLFPMTIDHPFQLLFETLGRLPESHAVSVNRHAAETLSDTLVVPLEHNGRCIMLRAPRAGHGKTHLLSRVLNQLGASHEFIPLHAASGSKIDASSVIDDVLKRLLRPLPASGGLTALDMVARRLFSAALQPLVASGEVPCQDREAAMAALRTRPIETFDFHHPHAVTAHWARENFEVLGQRLALELAQRTGSPLREVGFWVDLLFRYAATPLEHSDRARNLTEFTLTGTPSEGVAMDRLAALLGLLSSMMRVVLVADDLEGFSADESAALKFAALLGSLRQSVERLDVLLAVNRDIWESAFIPRLSGGLADRLSEIVIDLEPLNEKEMVDLLDSRAPGLGARVLEHIRLGGTETHARGLIRAAAVAWIEAERARKSHSMKSPTASVTAAPEISAVEEEKSEVPEIETETAADAQMSTVDQETSVQASEEPIPAADTPESVSGSPFTVEGEAVEESSDAPDTDRVDDLLRQFRERYGRGSL